MVKKPKENFDSLTQEEKEQRQRFSRLISRAMERNDLNQAELAQRVGVGQSMVSTWMGGGFARVDPGEIGLERATALANLLGVTLDDLWREIQGEAPPSPKDHKVEQAIAHLQSAYSLLKNKQYHSTNNSQNSVSSASSVWLDGKPMNDRAIIDIVRQAIATRFDVNNQDDFETGVNEFLRHPLVQEENWYLLRDEWYQVKRAIKGEISEIPPHALVPLAELLISFTGDERYEASYLSAIYYGRGNSDFGDRPSTNGISNGIH